MIRRFWEHARRVAKASGRDDGFTMIEMMVAALLIAFALGAVLQAMTTSSQYIGNSKFRLAANQVAQREMEQLKSVGWDALLMDGVPESAADPKDPRSGMGGTSGSPTFKPAPDAEAQPIALGDPPAVGEPDTRAVKVTATPWKSGNAGGMVYRFVTWGDDGPCGAACPGDQDYKRITVAATITSPAKMAPVILTSNVTNPGDAPAATTTTTPGPPPSEQSSFRTYYLYDTPAPFDSHQTPTTHTARDTQKFPDLMMQDLPPDPNPDPNNPTITVPVERYTTDVSGTYEGGAAIQQTDQCKGGDKKHEHMWVSRVQTTDTKLTGAGLASIFTQTVNGAIGTGVICVTIFDVPGTLKADGSVNGTVYKIGSLASHTEDPWPSTAMELLEFPFRFLPDGATYYTVTANRRIGVYLTTSNVSLQDMAVMYDHPDYPSSIGLELAP